MSTHPNLPRRRWAHGALAVTGAGWLSLSGCASPPSGRPSPSRAQPTEPAHPADPHTERRMLRLLSRATLGPRPGDLEALRALGIEHWIERQLDPRPIALPAALTRELDALVTLTMTPGELLAEYQAATGRLQQAAAPAAAAAPAVTAQPRRALVREAANDAVRARLLRALLSPRQLEELMVDFWFNHFNVFIGKGVDRVLVGHYEQHAIRPHVFGRFRDLLHATARHPAMLFYLDNAQSVAPGLQSPGGNGPRGLNENYARELMELHTLGVDAGYTQRDVTELARMFTGWTFDQRGAGHDLFRFVARRHDPGVKQWLGHRIDPAGVQEGRWALDVLAAHPSTARRIAFKLAQAFVADQPPAALVDRLSAAYHASQGETRALLRVLLASPELLDEAPGRGKFKTPYQYVLSCARAAGTSLPANVQPLAGAMTQLGMPLYGCQTPDGYRNTEDAWLAPEAMNRRLTFAAALAAGRLRLDEPAASAPVPAANVWPVIGPMLGERSREVIAHSAPAMQTALLMGSPEFMRR
jgi:uncharacterized protein (DUF1800 family)